MAIPGKVLLTEKEIKKKVRDLAKKVSFDYKREEVIMVGVLKGAFVFLSDLMRVVKFPVKVDFMAVKSYRGTETTGKAKILLDLREEIKGKNVLIVEDIVDTGITLNTVKKILEKRRPKTLKICALLDKRGRRREKVKLDYVGITIPNKYVVGYGLDFEDKYRNLPYVALLKDG
ncbi:MAG: hypoxanthine phosphoribosyltransferase [Nitrospirota bacterium]